MLAGAAASGVAITPVLIALLGGGGVVGAIVTLIKIRPDMSSASVSQAQGAMEVMTDLQDELRKALAEEREHADYWKNKYLRERQRRISLEQRWGPFPDSEADSNNDTPIP